MKFLGNVLATIVGLFVFTMVFFFGILLIGAIAGGDNEEVEVKSNTVINLDLSKIKHDYAGKTNYEDLTFLNGKEKHDGLFNIIDAIKNAKTDDDIKGISILNTTSDLGIAQTKALRDALEDFKKSGKFIYCYADAYSQKDYYLGSVANSIYINPIGELEFKGLSADIMFFKDFEDKYGIKMEVIRHGKYKSAVEPFLENKMSDANREQTTALLNSLWNSIVTEISKSRKVPVQHLNEIANGLLARTPEMAKAEKLVDKIAYEDVFHNDIKKAMKVAADEDYNTVNIDDYAERVATISKDYATKDKIAIIYAQGEIGNGEGDVNVIGEGSMRRALQEARKDEEVKAIVLRINSPGGNAMTSELIWREIELTKKVKPVVVSMGDYAASGGYYIACNANKIFAEANTITGSIGVFGVLPNFTEAANKMGLNLEQVKTHENAAAYTPFKPLDDKFRAFTQESVEKIYGVFVNRVAAGRKLSFAQVDAIGQGRVWSGQDAIKIGLVDKIGGMDEAIAEAAKLGKTSKYRTQDYPEYEKKVEDILAQFGLAQSKESLIKEEIGEQNYQVLQHFKQLNNQKGVQARMAYEIVLKY
ncbi:signal peptide peptidase SppA [Flavobacterium sp. SUN046]|uniref:signal peptide peptidase SppA n=1 Tax=Flavobacterium sp. SUN046 TaxID=3002440 RepID=UPI002DBA8378|nr:signal peptide peptidase SppA [Flavobacterium sp. SUN046]MEC4047803.1 signal peptide peptidase SppA [Flavobacterium sp. SUN046]